MIHNRSVVELFNRHCGLRVTSIGFRWWLDQGALKHLALSKRWRRYLAFAFGQSAVDLAGSDTLWYVRILHVSFWWQRRLYR